MNMISKLDVLIDNRKVGTLVHMKNGLTAFEYSDEWILDGFSISPLSLPLQKKVFVAKPQPFEGIFGVFSDTLPDGWGRLLVDRMLLKNRENPETVTPLQRLAIVGDSGMGALRYHPSQDLQQQDGMDNLDILAEECKKILANEKSDNFDRLFELGGSSGGARPKILVRIDEQEWMIKFPSSYDSDEIGYEEYCYMKCAEECGITVPEYRLFESEKCSGYFGTRRFDRVGEDSDRRVHMITASGLLETSHRIPNLDYHTIMKLTTILTHDDSQLEEQFRRMCFNVFAHNRDDHSKNFSFLYNEDACKWQLTPAYDLTYSYSLGGEHATCVDGNGRNPGEKEILAVAAAAGISENTGRNIMEYVRENVNKNLSGLMEKNK